MPTPKKKETYSQEKIKEANEIIAFCSDKLTKADKEIEKLLAEKRECEE